jgi:putative colanic acid biosynthesis glycosyltransferase WcaI
MSGARPFRLSVVFEFAGQPGHMMHSLLENLSLMMPALRVTILPGIFVKYRPGGFHPERLANLVWVYLRVAVHLLFRRPDAVIVQSAPPGVQLWTVAWAAIRGVPVFCWLMDYHPEFEARALERRGHRGVARLLRAVDAFLMRRFAAIITLDPAMTALVRTRASPANVLEHPTWASDGPSGLSPVSYRPGSGDGPLRLAYSGNLGAAHDLAPLRALLESIARRRQVRLFLIGGSQKGKNRFLTLCAGLGVAVEVVPRVPLFADLRGVYEKHKIDAGIVLLSTDSAGLASPSKFSGYINFGLPLVYIGPPGTNAATVCLQFHGGFRLPTEAGIAEADCVASGLLDEGQMSAAVEGSHAAAEHFARFDAKSLAGALAPRLVRGIA